MRKPIGVFDSGVGGLTVLKSLIKHFPNESFIYLGDTARVPYGTKGSSTIKRYSFEITKFLLAKNVKMIVVACNTASAVSVDDLSKSFDVPVIGVVDTSAKAAILRSNNMRIGVIGTKRTISCGAYKKALSILSSEALIFEVPCPMFVPLVEEGWLDNKIALLTAEIYLKELKKKSIDTLILGCTHYPLLSNVIRNVMGDVVLIESGDATSIEVEKVLNNKGLNGEGPQKVKYYVTDDSSGFDKIANIFMPQMAVKSDIVLL